MQKLKQFVLTLTASSAVLFPALAVPASVAAQNGIAGGACTGATNAVNGGANGACDETSGQSSIQEIVQTIVNIFSIIVGAVAVIMIIYGGFRYITSGGDTNGVTSAKNTILYAVVGLIIVALAQIIVRFVIGVGGDAAEAG